MSYYSLFKNLIRFHSIENQVRFICFKDYFAFAVLKMNYASHFKNLFGFRHFSFDYVWRLTDKENCTSYKYALQFPWNVWILLGFYMTQG